MALPRTLPKPSLDHPWASCGPFSEFLALSWGFLGCLKNSLKQRVWSTWPFQGPPQALLETPLDLIIPPLSSPWTLVEVYLFVLGLLGLPQKQLKTKGLEHMALRGALQRPPGDPGCTSDAPKSSPDDLVDGPDEPRWV